MISADRIKELVDLNDWVGLNAHRAVGAIGLYNDGSLPKEALKQTLTVIVKELPPGITLDELERKFHLNSLIERVLVEVK